MSSMTETSERIPAAERREQILAAASMVFGERGYAAATTDQVAKAAGISQPYVVRMFGGKENLFLEVVDRALQKLLVTFRGVIAADRAAGGKGSGLGKRIGASYVELIEDRGLLLSLMQAFVSGHEPAIGAKAREGFLQIFRLLRDEAGLRDDETRDFLAQGMLLNTVIALRIPQEYADDATAKELMDCVFPTQLDTVMRATGVAR